MSSRTDPIQIEAYGRCHESGSAQPGRVWVPAPLLRRRGKGCAACAGDWAGGGREKRVDLGFFGCLAWLKTSRLRIFKYEILIEYLKTMPACNNLRWFYI